MHVMAYLELLLPPSVNQSMFYFMSVNSHQGDIRLKQINFFIFYTKLIGYHRPMNNQFNNRIDKISIMQNKNYTSLPK